MYRPPFVIPLFPLIARLLPARGGTYRAKSVYIQRLLFGRIWANVDRCSSPAQARRIAGELNSYAAR